MEHWELVARESIRDLVARYNANGDTGRFEQLPPLFAPDAVMDAGVGGEHKGHAEILSIFTGARDRATANNGDVPTYLRHMTATHQIDIIDENNAKGRCYYFVITAIGLDHWGRYIDEYKTVDGVWKFARRRVTVDGNSAAATFARAEDVKNPSAH
jgi:hypothetical protein